MTTDIRDGIVASARALRAAEDRLKEMRSRWAVKRKELDAKLRECIEAEEHPDWRANVLQAWQTFTHTRDYAKECLAQARQDVLSVKTGMGQQIEAMDQLELSFDDKTQPKPNKE